LLLERAARDRELRAVDALGEVADVVDVRHHGRDVLAVAAVPDPALGGGGAGEREERHGGRGGEAEDGEEAAGHGGSPLRGGHVPTTVPPRPEGPLKDG